MCLPLARMAAAASERQRHVAIAYAFKKLASKKYQRIVVEVT